MLFMVLVLMTKILNPSHEPTLSGAARSTVLSKEEVCEMALMSFMRRTDSDLARFIKPQLQSIIAEATSSPDSDSDDPSPRRFIKKLSESPDGGRSVPKHEIDEIVLSAVQKAFEARDAEIAKISSKVEGMYSKKHIALITTVVGAIATIVSSLASVYGTMHHLGNCTK